MYLFFQKINWKRKISYFYLIYFFVGFVGTMNVCGSPYVKFFATNSYLFLETNQVFDLAIADRIVVPGGSLILLFTQTQFSLVSKDDDYHYERDEEASN